MLLRLRLTSWLNFCSSYRTRCAATCDVYSSFIFEARSVSSWSSDSVGAVEVLAVQISVCIWKIRVRGTMNLVKGINSTIRHKAWGSFWISQMVIKIMGLWQIAQFLFVLTKPVIHYTVINVPESWDRSCLRCRETLQLEQYSCECVFWCFSRSSSNNSYDKSSLPFGPVPEDLGCRTEVLQPSLAWCALACWPRSAKCCATWDPQQSDSEEHTAGRRGGKGWGNVQRRSHLDRHTRPFCCSLLEYMTLHVVIRPTARVWSSISIKLLGQGQ